MVLLQTTEGSRWLHCYPFRLHRAEGCGVVLLPQGLSAMAYGPCLFTCSPRLIAQLKSGQLQPCIHELHSKSISISSKSCSHTQTSWS